MNTSIISAFPGTGKTYFFKKHGKVLDSDSSKFDKQYFPDNYIKHIKENIGKVPIIFVSSHKEVREALIDNDIKFTLVYPDISLKNEYIQRYQERGNDENFINLISSNWELWINELQNQKGCEHIILKSGKFIGDIS